MKGSIAVIKRPPAIPIKTALNIPPTLEEIMKIANADRTKAIVIWSFKNGTESIAFWTPARMKGVIKIAAATATISGEVRNFLKSSTLILGNFNAKLMIVV